MKKIQYIKALSFLLLGLPLLTTSCRKNLLDQYSEADPSSNTFWTRPEDARMALIGNYAAFRPCFDRDYHFDGHGDFLKMYNTGAAPISMTVNNPIQVAMEMALLHYTGHCMGVLLIQIIL